MTYHTGKKAYHVSVSPCDMKLHATSLRVPYDMECTYQMIHRI